MEALNRVWCMLDKIVFTIVKHVCVVILGVLVTVVFYIFFGRYVLGKGPMWGEPLSLFCLVWMSVLGSAMVVREDAHLRVTMFDAKMSKGALLGTDILSSLCIGVFGVFLIIYGWQLTMNATGNNMAGINIPYAYMYISLPVTGVLYLLALIEAWRRRLTNERKQVKE